MEKISCTSAPDGIISTKGIELNSASSSKCKVTTAAVGSMMETGYSAIIWVKISQYPQMGGAVDGWHGYMSRICPSGDYGLALAIAGPSWTSSGDHRLIFQHAMNDESNSIGYIAGINIPVQDTTFVLNEYNMLIAVHDVTGLQNKLYINGVLVKTATIPETYTPANCFNNSNHDKGLLFGVAAPENEDRSGYVDGKFDEITLTDRIISDADATELYEAGII